VLSLAQDVAAVALQWALASAVLGLAAGAVAVATLV
jgi:hypothetical protein